MSTRTPRQIEGIPLLRALPSLLAQEADFLDKARARHGDIYRIKLGPLDVVMLCHPKHAQYILRDSSTKYRKEGSLWTSVRTLLGNGLVVSEGEFWLRQRRMMQPYFQRERLVGLVDPMVDAIDEALVTWDEAAAAGRALCPTTSLSAITMKVIAKALLGGDILPEEVALVIEHVTFVLSYMFRGVIAHQLPSCIPVPGRQRYQGTLRDIDVILFKVIERSRQRKEQQGRASVVTMLLDTVNAETAERMSVNQLRDEVMSLFVAGFETTALALAWTLQFLMREPEVLARLRAEVDTVVGTARPNASHLPALSYTRQVFMEVLRLRPPVWWLTRCAAVDDEIDGSLIPARAMVTAPPYVIHRHPDYWEDPERFAPERFSPERAALRHKLAWVPFGVGPRQCIGKELALMEGQLVLARLVQRYDFAPAPPHQQPAPLLAMTLQIKNGTPLRIRRRRAASAYA